MLFIILFTVLFVVTFLLLGYLLGQMKITKTNKTSYLARAAVIATIYALITYLFKPISYGTIQVRVSEALTLLPLVESSAIPGLFIGCLIANILGGMGPWDIYLGSIITLIAACITAKMPGPVLGSLPPIVLNALGVSYYLSIIYNVPYLVTALYVGLGQLISVAGLGIPLYYLIQRTSLKDFLKKE